MKWLYIISFILSIIFISIFLINLENMWHQVSLALGTNILSAVILATFIDLINHKNEKKKSETLLKIAFEDFGRALMNFFIVYKRVLTEAVDMYNSFPELDKIKDNINLTNFYKPIELMKKIISLSEKIYSGIMPILDCDSNYNNRKSEIESHFKNNEKEILEKINDFKKNVKNFQTIKSLLMANVFNNISDGEYKKIKFVIDSFEYINKKTKNNNKNDIETVVEFRTPTFKKIENIFEDLIKFTSDIIWDKIGISAI